MEKMSRAERARQFMPFAALRGFEELIREQTKEIAPTRELSEEQAARLSARLSRLERGMIVEVVYYAQDGYVTLHGMVSDVDLPMRTLTVIKTKIPIDDLADLRIEDPNESEQ